MEYNNQLKKKIFFQVLPYIIFILILTIDLITKNNFIQEGNFIKNSGFIFGLWNDSSEFLRVLILSSVGFFLLSLFVVLTFIIHNHLWFLKSNLSFLFGGLAGNLIERTLHHHTTDFIPLYFASYYFQFNIADVFIWIGIINLIFYVFRYDKKIWFEGNKRQYFLTYPKEQISLSLKFIALFALIFIFFAIFSTTYLSIIGKQFNIPGFQNIVRDYFLVFSLIFIIFGLYIFALSIYFTSNIFGPIKAFEKFIRSRIKNPYHSSFKLRSNDRLKELEELANLIIDSQKIDSQEKEN